jgi:hypothetical protein
MMIRTTIAAKAALDDPLRLAEIYRAGLGRHWNSLRQGSVQLAALNLKASAARLQQAVKISEFPGEILDLFKHVGIVNRTARELIRASNEQGLEQLKLRAATIDPAGKSRTQLFALLCGDEVAGSSYRAHSKERPLALDQRYRDGLHSGLWSSTREAAQVLGVDQARLVKASNPTLSQQELMNRFVGLEGNAVNVKVKRGTAGKLVLEFHYDADDPANETRLSMMAMWLRDIKPNVR